MLRILLPSLGLLEVTSKHRYVLLQRHNFSVHLYSSSKRPGSFLSCCLCFTQHVQGKKFATASAGEELRQFFNRNHPHSAFVSGLIQSACYIEPLEFAIWYFSLEIGQDDTFKSTSLVLSRCESTCLWMEIPTCINSIEHGLTHRIWI